MVIKDVVVSGEPARIVTGMEIPGETIKQKTAHFKLYHDDLRKEWTAGDSHQGAVLVNPTDGGDVGAIFFNADGYPNMCGHLTMAIGAAFAFRNIDTSAGRVSVRHTPEFTAFTNVPCFYHSLMETGTDALGVIPVHVVFGGDFFLLVNMARLSEEFSKENRKELVNMALHIFWHVKQRIQVAHPLRPWINYVDVIMLYKQLSKNRFMTLTAWGKDESDLCPCGTGTSSLLAMLHYFGQVNVGEEIKNYTLDGNGFEAVIRSLTTVGEFNAVVPEIFGKVRGVE